MLAALRGKDATRRRTRLRRVPTPDGPQGKHTLQSAFAAAAARKAAADGATRKPDLGEVADAD